MPALKVDGAIDEGAPNSQTKGNETRIAQDSELPESLKGLSEPDFKPPAR
jgi:hypothetical protein